MSFEPAEEVQGALTQAIHDACSRFGIMVTRHVVVLEGLEGADSERALWIGTHADAPAWDVMGLLTYALTQAKASAIDDREEDEDP